VADLEGQRIIWTAACITAVITAALTVYAFTTKEDYTMKGGLLFVAWIGLFLFGLVAFLSGI